MPTSTCDNPKCSCDPCTCVRCRCGVAKLGDLERRVIDVLWEDPAAERTGRDVADHLPGYAYTTVATVLDRLTSKGLVSRRVDGRTIRFATTGTRSTHAAQQMHEALILTGDPDAALASFAETLSPSEADALERALGELSARPGRRRRSPPRQR
jgi:predicted transcriptional regulator